MKRVRPSDLCAVIDEDDIVYVAPLPDGPVLVLDGVSALIWQTALDPQIDDTVAYVADATGQRPEDIAGHVEAFVTDLVRRGALVVDDHD
ncbi:PqqD family peptide modification chaperone [Microbacterium sp. 2216-1]|uniref:PqqD family peptide modification chaperone n=1 Tax=Microbacterium TaxID=33882 RepID=UPI0019D33E3F|nr:PqqD family peptide modification chaperone [Microbacterium esteraromaticum]MBN7793406.1 PqqD family peptide modification chaperone [Microbacterium esteraromaticum]MCA1305481.1 PqqD family protein [Microbacterium esteraromaticum]